MTAVELESAFKYLIKLDQSHYFSCEISALKLTKPLPSESKLLNVTPKLDDENVLRVGGRLERGDLPEEIKHPIILHHESHLARLIIADVHESYGHSRPGRTLNELRTQFYVIKFRQTVQSVIFKCKQCRRQRLQPVAPLMAALPPQRLQAHLPAFTHVGVDYFGPYEVVILRRKVKRWIVLFTCLVTRAVHLEVAFSLDTSSFLMSFWRFADRRGYPVEVFSDNGTNLTAGEKELRALIAEFNQERIGSQLAARKIAWRFSPPAAPHFGGVWERLVQSAKRALNPILHNRSVTDEVLQTAIVGVESLLNGRPLTHIAVDPREPEALTPNHFVMGRANPRIQPDLSEERLEPSLKTWRAAQTIVSHFWNRWKKEYVPNLIERRKWLSVSRNLAPGDIVIVADSPSRRGDWPLGRVIATYPGPDGVARSALVKTQTGEYRRPVAKLCLLEASPSQDVSPETEGAM